MKTSFKTLLVKSMAYIISGMQNAGSIMRLRRGLAYMKCMKSTVYEIENS